MISVSSHSVAEGNNNTNNNINEVNSHNTHDDEEIHPLIFLNSSLPFEMASDRDEKKKKKTSFLVLLRNYSRGRRLWVLVSSAVMTFMVAFFAVRYSSRAITTALYSSSSHGKS